MKNPYQKAYENNRVMNASPGGLIVLLYEGAIRFNEQALANMNFKTYDKVNHFISRTLDILVELKTSLSLEAGGELAKNLNALYDYMLEKLRIANKDKDAAAIKEVNHLLNELLTSWKTIAHDRPPSPAQELPSTALPPETLDGIDGFSIKG